MNIVLVVDSFAPAWGYGGPPRLVATLVDQFTQLGHHITVLTTDALGDHRQPRGNDHTYQVVRARNFSNKLAWMRKIFLPIPPAGVLSVFQEADVIHLFQSRSLLNVLGYLGARSEGVPLVLSPLGSLPVVGGWDRIPKVMYDAVFLEPIKEWVKAVLGQTRHEVQVCRSWGVESNRVHLVPLCVNLSDYASLPRRGRFVSRVTELVEFEQFYIFIGRIHKLKGLEMLVRAFSRAFPHSNHALVIAGKDEGGHVAELKRLVSTVGLANRVFFHGPLYGPQKLEALVDSHAYVITPSIYEETSLAALEAAACETPALTTEQSEIPWLEEYSAGFTVKYDLESVAAGLVRMSEVEGASRRQMGLMARRLVVERFAPAVVAAQIERVYRTLDTY